MIRGKKVLVSISVCLIILSLSSCSSKSDSRSNSALTKPSQSLAMDSATTKGNADFNMGTTTDVAASKSDTKNEATASVQTKVAKDASKIVKNYSLQLQTLKFDEAVTAISSKCNDIGGYVEVSNISGTNVSSDNTVANRTASLKLRIPKEQYVSFKAIFKGLGNILNQQETGENITQQYFDTDAHLTSLKIQEERLLDLLKKSGDLKSILEIEKELQTVRYTIESLTTSLKKMDNMVDYTTFSISINEVQEIKKVTVKPISLMDKISEGFKGSVKLLIDIFKNLLILIAYVLPFAVIILIAYLVGRYIYKLIKKRQNKVTTAPSDAEK
ncbi:MAG: DUF4349 domain-containing protein [Clostridiaceae bacterium]|nr:DUF4349 domain-containing protein [Clostridiaceae bacterium]